MNKEFPMKNKNVALLAAQRIQRAKYDDGALCCDVGECGYGDGHYFRVSWHFPMGEREEQEIYFKNE